MQQRSDEWFQARLGKATSSRFADVMARLRNGQEAAARKNYRAELVVERLTGQPTDTYRNGAMAWGEEMEELAKTEYMLETGNEVEEVGFVEHKGMAAGASPDGLIGKEGLIEIKCPNTATHIEYLLSGKLPSKYVPQVQGQLWITGRQWCDFVSYDPRMPAGLQLFIVRVERDEEKIDEIAKEVSQFLSGVDDLEIELEAKKK